MGLDMYFYLEKYESCGWWHKNFETKSKRFYPKAITNSFGDIAKRNFLSKEAKYQIGYWRKANAIHKWFVDNCADGEDDCRPIYVDCGKARELLKSVNEVLENHDLAPELLPTREGFFFGDTNYDEWYFEDLEYTKDLLEKAIEFVETHHNYEMLYQASW